MIRTMVCAVALLVVAEVAAGGTISAEASGSSSPTLAYSGTLTNGNFLIETLHSYPLGDGGDDWTSWTFDFTDAAGYSAFPTTVSLASALLTLTLTPGDVSIATDVVWMDDLDEIEDSAIRSLTVSGGTKTVTVELLDYYSSADILDVLTAGSGFVPMGYHDDATVSYAKLELASVPLPSTAQLGLGLLGALGLLRRIRS